MPDTRPYIYWDTSVLLSYFAGIDGRVQECQSVLDEVERNRVKLFTSPLAMIEVAAANAATGNVASRALLDEFFATYVEYMNLDRLIAEGARTLLRAHPDLSYTVAVHLSSAQRAKCTALHTYVDQLLLLDGHTTGIRIRTPYLAGPSGQERLLL